MKLIALIALVPFASAVCTGNQVSLTFDDESGQHAHEVCPAGGSCVNMQSGFDGWAQSVFYIQTKPGECVRFFKSYNCPTGQTVWQPPCDGRKNQVPADWRNGAMKSYTVWKM